MCRFTRLLCISIVTSCLTISFPKFATAQYPVTITAAAPVVPAVVGYVPERRGLFGRRTVYRPVVTAVTPAVTVAQEVTVSRPVTVSAPVVVSRPVTVSPPVTLSHPVTVARPIAVTEPVTVRYQPVVTPVTTYYAPVAVPVTTYRVIYPPVVPVFEF